MEWFQFTAAEIMAWDFQYSSKASGCFTVTPYLALSALQTTLFENKGEEGWN